MVDLRDSFDSQARKVGLRDSTWIAVGVLVLLVVAFNWRDPSPFDLFSRILLLGGGIAILVAVGCRRFLED